MSWDPFRGFHHPVLRLVHVAVALLLGCLSIADLALTVGAGGARVSLPLVLFAITECGYVPLLNGDFLSDWSRTTCDFTLCSHCKIPACTENG